MAPQANWVNFCSSKLETLHAALENVRKGEALEPSGPGSAELVRSADGVEANPRNLLQNEELQENIRRVRLQRAQVSHLFRSYGLIVNQRLNLLGDSKQVVCASSRNYVPCALVHAFHAAPLWLQESYK